MSQVLQERLINVAEAAEFLHRSRNGVYILARQGKVPHYRVGNSVRFDLDELKAWLESNRRGPRVATDG